MAEEFKFEDEEPSDDLFGESSQDQQRPESDDDLDMKEVEVAGVFEHRDQASNQALAYFVLLKDVQERSVVIWIGRFEAAAISLALEGTSADRPLPYDLMNNVIIRMGGALDRVLVDDLWNNTYYAKVRIINDGNIMDIDSRPSDAIALALRAKAPIYMAEAVLAAVSEEQQQ